MWWRNLIDLAADAVTAEGKYRRENPCATAKMFRARVSHWRGKGRDGLAKVATRRVKRWEARCRAAGGDC